MRLRPVLLIASLLFAAFAPTRAVAQEGGWNDARTLELIGRAIARRTMEVVDTTLESYRADGRGYVYFLLDSPELGRQSLVRTDQVAVDVFWRAPNEVRQRVIGWREQKELPITRLHYYLDRLTVVQDNYGQAIVIADGDNVRDVPHPVASGGLDVYDYQLVDSLTLGLPGVPEPVTVYEVQVRPRNGDEPGIIGRVYLDAASAALVRMTFTFTAASYIDPRLDYINVTLENGLWLGRFWLPHEQRLDIRREIPELDLPFGTVIRTRMRISNYRFNESGAEPIFAYPAPITFAPPAERENFPFEEPIDAGWRSEGIGQPAEIAELRREARELVEARMMSGLQSRRLGFGSVSDLVRYNRADGFVLGGGLGFDSGDLRGRVQGGWAFGASQPTARLDLDFGMAPGTTATLTGYLNRTGDVGGSTVSSGLAHSISALFFAKDWTDPFHASGVAAKVTFPSVGNYTFGLGARVEHQRSARRTSSFSFFGEDEEMRDVRPIVRGVHASGELTARRQTGLPGGGAWVTDASASLNSLEGDEYLFGRLALESEAEWSLSRRRTQLLLGGRAAALVGEAPVQDIFLLGGRGTVPGYNYRSLGGGQILTANALAAADILHPWLRGRMLGYLGWSGDHNAEAALNLWNVPASDGVRASVGAGIGIFYDLLHIDVIRGLSAGGRTDLRIEINPDFWGFL